MMSWCATTSARVAGLKGTRDRVSIGQGEGRGGRGGGGGGLACISRSRGGRRARGLRGPPGAPCPSIPCWEPRSCQHQEREPSQRPRRRGRNSKEEEEGKGDARDDATTFQGFHHKLLFFFAKKTRRDDNTQARKVRITKGSTQLVSSQRDVKGVNHDASSLVLVRPRPLVPSLVAQTRSLPWRERQRESRK